MAQKLKKLPVVRFVLSPSPWLLVYTGRYFMYKCRCRIKASLILMPGLPFQEGNGTPGLYIFEQNDKNAYTLL